MTENKPTYFEDMWLSLENELSSFDSFVPSDYVSAPSSSTSLDSPSSDTSTSPAPLSSYEELLELQNTSIPDNSQLRSKNRKERIEAIRDLYNKTPMTFNTARLEQVAKNLYKKGYVKQANEIMEKIKEEKENSIEEYERSIFESCFTGSTKTSTLTTAIKIAQGISVELQAITPPIVEIYHDYFQRKINLRNLDKYPPLIEIVEQKLKSIRKQLKDAQTDLIPHFKKKLIDWNQEKLLIDSAILSNNFIDIDNLKKDFTSRHNSRTPALRDLDLGPPIRYMDELVQSYIENMSQKELAGPLSSSTEQYRNWAKQRHDKLVNNESTEQKDAQFFIDLYKTAQSLYGRGYVKRANELVEVIEKNVSKHFSYVSDEKDFYKILTVDVVSPEDKTITVEIIDKNDKSAITEEFDSVTEALEFFNKSEDSK